MGNTKKRRTSTRWRRITRRVAAAFVALSLLVLIAAWIVGGRLVAPANRSVGPPPDDFQAATVEIDSSSGSTLAAWHLKVPDATATIILLHPVRGDRRSMLSRARMLHDAGYSTLLVDLQAHGGSPGENITMGYLERFDVLAAVEFIRDHGPEQKIGVIGWSLGGAATLLASPDIDVLVIESVYPDITRAVHNRVQMRLGPLHRLLAPLLLVQLEPRLGVAADQLRPIEQIGDLACPVLVLGGTQDLHTTSEKTQALFDAANQPKELYLFEGATHQDLFEFDPSEYKSRVLRFVEEHLADE